MWKVTELSRYARLADTVDRLDPLLRQGYKLLVVYWGGYPNSYLLKLYGQHVTFWYANHWWSRWTGWLLCVLAKWTGYYLASTVDYKQWDAVMLTKPPVLRCPEPEPFAGFDPTRPYLCIGVRDLAYYKFYGSNRDRTIHRCPKQHIYKAVALDWAKRGWQVVRMGVRVSEEWGSYPNIFDYASSPHRTDKQDIRLLAHCEFVLAGDTGLYSGAAAFDRPAVVSDLFLIRHSIYSSHKRTPNLFMPLLFKRKDGTLLSFSELIRRNRELSHVEDCERLGFTAVNNTAEDILAATTELYQRAHGHWQPSPDALDRQRAFNTLYAKLGTRCSTGIVSTAFLKKHEALLC